MNIKELTKQEFEAAPIYEEKYVHVDFLSDEKVAYEGQVYLVLDTITKGRYWVGKNTVVAHMVGFYDIDEPKSSDSADWKISDGNVILIKDRNRYVAHALPKGTKYQVVRAARSTLNDWIDVGTIAVRYPDVKYPSV